MTKTPILYPLRKVIKINSGHGFGYYCNIDLECGHAVAWPVNQVSKVRTKVRCKKCEPVVNNG